MDLNDLEARLKRVYATIGDIYDPKVEENIKTETIVKGSHFEQRITFGHLSSADLEKTVMNAIHGVASLKDHIKIKMKKNGKDPQEVEELINRSASLAIITDLDNLDKHAESKYKRSGKNPRIDKIQQGLQPLPGQNSFSISMKMDGFRPQIDDTEGDYRIVISASIIDDKGNHLINFDDLISTGIKEYEEFIKAQNLSS